MHQTVILHLFSIEPVLSVFKTEDWITVVTSAVLLFDASSLYFLVCIKESYVVVFILELISCINEVLDVCKSDVVITNFTDERGFETTMLESDIVSVISDLNSNETSFNCEFVN